MILGFLFWVIFLSWPIIALAQAPANIRNPNCPSSCGNVTLPFPFGIGAGCYIDDWFAIDCIASKPFIRSINLEVLEITVSKNTMRVNHPVFNSCEEQATSKSVNLEETPFSFSNTSNRFAGVACNKLAKMSSIDSIVAGCFSVCDNRSTSNRRANSCNGINCCHSTIPLPVKRFNISLDAIPDDHGRKQKECKYAFLVDQHWFGKKLTDLQDVQGMTQVPVILDWGIYTSTFDPFLWKKSNLSEYYRPTSNCEISKSSSSQIPIAQCYCKSGYEGNPYFPGCRDVNECAIDGICGPYLNCSNDLGSYRCYRASNHAFEKQSEISRIIMNSLLIIVFPGLLGLVLLIGSWRLLLVIRRRMKRKEKFFKRNGGLLLQQRLLSSDGSVDKCKLFNSKELNKATDRFNVNRILGQGGQGTVYKGMLTDGRIIAVKKSKVVNEGKLEEFINEIVILSQINHRNVVKLLGCCLETEVPLLVYEFVPNGTLSQYLDDQNEELQLTWHMRLRIATEVAGALSYLHSAASLPIYHRDIKSTNILLDEKYRAKIADFGTSRSIDIDQTHLTIIVQGTFGYLDPQYFQSSQFTDKSDVYSFGVVLAELLTGQKPISLTRSEEDRNLATYFILSMKQNCLYDILNDRVKSSGNKEEIMATANVAKRCLNINGKRRPTMKEVAMELEKIQASQKDCNVKPNYMEVDEDFTTNVIEPWAIDSNSTDFAISTGIFDNIDPSYRFNHTVN